MNVAIQENDRLVIYTSVEIAIYTRLHVNLTLNNMFSFK